jgi:hypothetical protein
MGHAPSNTPDPGRSSDPDNAKAFTKLRARYPHFRIWRDTISTRPGRFIARRLTPGTGLHTVVTPDLVELSSVLRNAQFTRKEG